MSERAKNRQQKASPANKLEAAIRREYVPNQIIKILNDILAIEVNALWRATPEGKTAAKRDDNYSAEDLAAVLKKQEENRSILRVKADFLKGLLDQQESHV